MKLKIFLGYAAGVGKTYAMLEAAHQRQAEGVDVVVGYIETHGREETEALVSGLEVLPREAISYRGVALTELDIDAVLARQPELVLVDELVHTNAPGSRHVKRYQDVEEFLAAGIDVYTTLNVQHVESLTDVIAQITGVIVRETIPDSVIDESTQIELVDLPPNELLIRLREGKVYIPEQAARAIQKFFRKGNLTALRELTMRRAAERVDDEMASICRPSPFPVPGQQPSGCWCVSAQREAPTATQTSVVEVLQEVRPGIYMSNDPADFPFPTSGYDVYILERRTGTRRPNRSFKPISKPCMKMRVYEM